MNLEQSPRVAARLESVYYSTGSKAGDARVITCPFCMLEHRHGSSLGSRVAHCTDYVAPRSRKVDPRDTEHNPGYILCDPADDIDWELERVVGQLIVLRNRYRRLSAEHDAMQPLSAREKRVRQNLRAEADDIAAILDAAGVTK
jgi:hypothetical protein